MLWKLNQPPRSKWFESFNCCQRSFSAELKGVAALNPRDKVGKLNRIVAILVVEKVFGAASLVSARVTRCTRLAVIGKIEARQRQILRGIRRYPKVWMGVPKPFVVFLFCTKDRVKPALKWLSSVGLKV